MTLDMSSFGSLISSARKALKLSQKELAAKIVKEDGEAITPQYLNDIEHDRRSPSSDYLVKQFAKVLKADGVTPEVLAALAGILSDDDLKRVKRSTPEQVNNAMVAFRKELKK
jgi:transcriptional regulator with XRE-family HTH domain